MNQNYKAVLEDLKPAIDNGIQEMIRAAYSQVEEFIPYDELFPDSWLAPYHLIRGMSIDVPGVLIGL